MTNHTLNSKRSFAKLKSQSSIGSSLKSIFEKCKVKLHNIAQYSLDNISDDDNNYRLYHHYHRRDNTHRDFHKTNNHDMTDSQVANLIDDLFIDSDQENVTHANEEIKHKKSERLLSLKLTSIPPSTNNENTKNIESLNNNSTKNFTIDTEHHVATSTVNTNTIISDELPKVPEHSSTLDNLFENMTTSSPILLNFKKKNAFNNDNNTGMEVFRKSEDRCSGTSVAPNSGSDFLSSISKNKSNNSSVNTNSTNNINRNTSGDDKDNNSNHNDEDIHDNKSTSDSETQEDTISNYDVHKECQMLRLKQGDKFKGGDEIFIKRRELHYKRFKELENIVVDKDEDCNDALFEEIPEDAYYNIYRILLVEDKPLKKPLNLANALKVVNAGWISDKTWENAVHGKF
ncbi:uncharacterized protein SCODWIG_01339 [Saccharomycodes ludwigii]|uniref:Gag1-like clamp domain-containing protein n=1 Tax=Saccharomycodes ludwigii TaxID=36035 RepID=A0A376B4G0_9ASCO|nr:uncharacterized protein SCODWIG_01339 [Saccharomycodes ludwigii]